MSSPRVVLITGANRGIGLAILQSLALHSLTDVYLLGTRSLSNGDSAISELHTLGIPTPTSIIPVELDVASDASIRAAVSFVSSTYGHLDVLINNAGIAKLTSASDFSDYRDVFGTTYDTNVTSVALCTQLFLPLLRLSQAGGMVINISSAQGSLALAESRSMSPPVAAAYHVSKAALNLLTLLMSKDPENQGVRFQLVSPGHCRTEFNGYRGKRDPVEGANVVVELIHTEQNKDRKCGFWETKGESRELAEIPW